MDSTKDQQNYQFGDHTSLKDQSFRSVVLDPHWVITCYGLSNLFSIICAISLLYFLSQFVKLSKLLVVEKRHFCLLKLQCILSVIYLMISPLVSLYGLYEYINYIFPSYSFHPHDIICHIALSFNALIIHSLTVVVLFRFYLMYYDAKYFNCLTKLEWTIYIDENLKHKYNNLFVNNKSTCGDSTWLGKRIFLPLSIIKSLPFAIFYLFFNYGGTVTYIDVSSHLLIIISIAVLYYKTPNIKPSDDCFFVIEEMKAIAIIWLLLALMYLALLPLLSFDDNLVVYLSRMLRIFIGHLSVFLSAAYSTFMVRRKILKSHYSENKKTGCDSDKSLIDSLKQFLCDPKGINLFAHHLIREYSVECIVCYVELIEYKRFVKKVFTDMNLDIMEIFEEDDEKEYRLLESDLLPKSNIIYGSGHSQNLLEVIAKIGRDLCQKYVVKESAMEVNLPSRLRNAFAKFIDVDIVSDIENNSMNDIKTMYFLFEEVIGEMYKLMVYSYGRWKLTPRFQQNCGYYVKILSS